MQISFIYEYEYWTPSTVCGKNLEISNYFYLSIIFLISNYLFRLSSRIIISLSRMSSRKNTNFWKFFQITFLMNRQISRSHHCRWKLFVAVIAIHRVYLTWCPRRSICCVCFLILFEIDVIYVPRSKAEQHHLD